MADIETYLKRLASDVYPTASQLERAATSNNHLRAELQTGNMECRIVDTSLSGSYVRHTVLRPLQDVDVIVEIDPSHWSKGLWATLFNGLPKPEAVITTFQRAISHRYKQHGSRVFKQRRSVRLSLGHLDLDVVPAVPDANRQDWFRIPDRDLDRWIPTAPKVHSPIATSLNDATGTVQADRAVVEALEFESSGHRASEVVCNRDAGRSPVSARVAAIVHGRAVLVLRFCLLAWGS